MQLEQIEAHVEGLDLSQVQSAAAFTAEDVQRNPTEVLQKICGIFKVAKPILQVVAGLFFVPKKWRDTINILISSLDQICPGD